MPADPEPSTLGLTQENIDSVAKLANLPAELLEAALEMRLLEFGPSIIANGLAREALRRIEHRKLLVQRISRNPRDQREDLPLMLEQSKEAMALRKDVREEHKAIREDSRLVLQAIKDGHFYDEDQRLRAMETDDIDESDAMTRRLLAQEKERKQIAKAHAAAVGKKAKRKAIASG